MNEIIKPFGLSLFEPIGVLGVEVLEIGIDSILDDGLFKNMPIVAAITSLAKFAQNVHDRNLLRQTLTFIKEFNDGNIDSEKLSNYRQRIDSDKKKAESELGRVIILLNSHIETIKSKVLADFFRSYVNGMISWEQFVELSEANRRIFESDYSILCNENKNHVGVADYPNRHKYNRLISLGLMEEINKSGLLQSMETMAQKWITITSLGKIFCELQINTAGLIQNSD